MKTILLLFLPFFLSLPCLALTPKERDLVTGLSRINMELRANNASQEAQIERDATDALFASQKIDSLSVRLAESKKLEGDQEFELGLQQKLIKESFDAAVSACTAAILLACGGGLQVGNAEELTAALQSLLDDETKRRSTGQNGMGLLLENSGATEMQMEVIKKMLNSEG